MLNFGIHQVKLSGVLSISVFVCMICLGNIITVLGSGVLKILFLCLEQLNTIMAVMYCKFERCSLCYYLITEGLPMIIGVHVNGSYCY
jgi:hypothetical protein